VIAGKRKMNSNRKARADSVANKKNRRCCRTISRTLRIYRVLDLIRLRKIAPSVGRGLWSLVSAYDLTPETCDQQHQFDPPAPAA
jgi:hypothetical protein